MTNEIITGVTFNGFFSAVPQARAIYNRHQVEFNDNHSNWLGRWVKRAEKYISEANLSSDDRKQEVTDKLIKKLVTEILVSPYDHAPFVANTEKRPVLFKGLLFPYWMLEDILKLVGNLNGLHLAKPHALINEMLAWSKSLEFRSQVVPSKSTELVPVMPGGALIVSSPTSSPSHLDSTLLVSIDFAEQPELTIIKLLTYRDLIKNAFREMELRKMNKGAKKQFKQIVKFGDEQKTLLEQGKIQSAQARAAHEQAVEKQFEDISHIQDSTQNIRNEHFQSIIDEMSAAEERMKKIQQDNKIKEAQLQALVDAQKNLRV